MKKIYGVLFIVVIVCILLAFCTINDSVKYPSGKDTVASFGDGTYQILRAQYRDETHISLNFSPTGVDLIQKVDTYEKKGDKVYITGTDQGSHFVNGAKESWRFMLFAAIDLNNNHIQICAIPQMDSAYKFAIDKVALDTGLITILEKYSDFSQKDRAVLDTMATA